ncbi:aminotransferase class V-fold PLP-dependent enzyme [Streptomyces globosus]|uniref:aminotransferase class V-fold PLP-dependent enzyme n=1 Tax=Streptomyces globosus TaxID=68209 RepID=UPI0037F6AD14
MNPSRGKTPPGRAPLLAVLGRDVTVPTARGDAAHAALDYAASTPVLAQVWEEVAAFAPRYASVHRGSGHLSRYSTAVFENSREEVARFLDLRADDRVVFTRSTTDSLNMLARWLPEGGSVYAFETDHHAALLPWRRREVVLLDAPDSPMGAVRILEEALRRRAPLADALVCVTGASNVTGEVWPVRELAAVAHGYGARTVLDAAQLVAHRQVSVRGLGVDWVAFSGHKLYAPFGAGVLAGRWDWPRTAEPYLAGGGASRSVRRGPEARLEVEWEAGVARHEGGTPNVVGAHAIASACRALRGVGFDALRAHEEHLVHELRAGLRGVPGLRQLSLFGGRTDRVPVVSFTVDGVDGLTLADRLSREYGIGVRAGLFCAHTLMNRLLGAPAAAQPAPAGCGTARLDAVRASFGAGTSGEHISRLVRAVRELVNACGAGRAT